MKYNIIAQAVANDNIPLYIYKYMDIECAKAIIKHNTIRFKSAPEFNDPFDGKAYVSGKRISVEDIYSHFDLTSLPAQKRDKELNLKIMDLNALHDVANAVYAEFDAHTAITCFSEVDDSLLMWAHYSNKHEGVCMKFDISKDLDFFSILAKVKYKEDFVAYDFSEVEKHIFDQYTTKGLDWKYEHEIRLIKINTVPGDFKFNKESLVEITFGCKSHKEDIDEIGEILKQHNYNGINLRMAMIASENYKLNFFPLPF